MRSRSGRRTGSRSCATGHRLYSGVHRVPHLSLSEIIVIHPERHDGENGSGPVRATMLDSRGPDHTKAGRS
jgi:hypothetical protein